jgi:YD repeat-containing protein
MGSWSNVSKLLAMARKQARWKVEVQKARTDPFTTIWGYDAYGRVTNKVDAAGNLLFVYKYDPDSRLTNRWSAAKGSTSYAYDAVGNLKSVVYPVSPAITLSYDALNRLMTLVDAVGTTVYGLPREITGGASSWSKAGHLKEPRLSGGLSHGVNPVRWRWTGRASVAK